MLTCDVVEHDILASFTLCCMCKTVENQYNMQAKTGVEIRDASPNNYTLRGTVQAMSPNKSTGPFVRSVPSVYRQETQMQYWIYKWACLGVAYSSYGIRQ